MPLINILHFDLVHLMEETSGNGTEFERQRVRVQVEKTFRFFPIVALIVNHFAKELRAPGRKFGVAELSTWHF